jgi:hypothetical protein
MASHVLGVLQPTVVFQVDGDAGCPPLWPASRSQPRRCSGSKHVPSPALQSNLRSETGVPPLKACCLNVLVQDLLEQVMYGHIMLLAAFFMVSTSDRPHYDSNHQL